MEERFLAFISLARRGETVVELLVDASIIGVEVAFTCLLSLIRLLFMSQSCTDISIVQNVLMYRRLFRVKYDEVRFTDKTLPRMPITVASGAASLLCSTSLARSAITANCSFRANEFSRRDFSVVRMSSPAAAYGLNNVAALIEVIGHLFHKFIQRKIYRFTHKQIRRVFILP